MVALNPSPIIRIIINSNQAGLENKGKDCWKNCNRQQGPCDWCGSMGFCCTKKNGWTDTSNGCDGSFGGETRHECALNPG